MFVKAYTLGKISCKPDVNLNKHATCKTRVVRGFFVMATGSRAASDGTAVRCQYTIDSYFYSENTIFALTGKAPGYIIFYK